MTTAPLLDARFPASSSAFIPEGSALRRLPLQPQRRRSAAFLATYEARALVYDCFWDARHEAVILVCPPALNLEPHLQQARFTVAGTEVKAAFYPSRSTTLVALTGVPDDAVELTFTFAGLSFTLPIQPNAAEALAGRRVLVTMNKNNDLDWIAAWAQWHVRLHGANACVLFDNGSTRYGPEDIAGVLSGIAGMEEVRVLSWPHLYGRKDPAVLDRPHYPHFLQVSSLNVALRRFGMCARGLLNCDIDELVGAGESDIFTQARQSPEGIVTLKGRWIEPLTDTTVTHGIPHLAYRHSHRLPWLSRCANKWALDPSRDWVRDLTAKPSVHRMYDVPAAIRDTAPVARFWHFKAINTGWKEARTSTRPWPLLLERPEALAQDVARYAERQPKIARS